MSKKKYEVVSTSEAYQMATDNGKASPNRNEEIESCAVFTLKSGKVVLIPFDSTTAAIFDTIDDCLEVIENERIDEIRAGNYFEEIKDDMLNIDSRYKSYIEDLETFVGRKLIFTTDVSYLNEISEDFKKKGIEKIEKSLRLQVNLGVFLGVILKEVVNGCWDIEEVNKNSRYNYYVPQIKSVDGRIYLLWKGINESLSNKKPFDIIEFLKASSFHWDIVVSEGKVVKS
jgi:hypothetical protein